MISIDLTIEHVLARLLALLYVGKEDEARRIAWERFRDAFEHYLNIVKLILNYVKLRQALKSLMLSLLIMLLGLGIITIFTSHIVIRTPFGAFSMSAILGLLFLFTLSGLGMRILNTWTSLGTIEKTLLRYGIDKLTLTRILILARDELRRTWYEDYYHQQDQKNA